MQKLTLEEHFKLSLNGTQGWDKEGTGGGREKMCTRKEHFRGRGFMLGGVIFFFLVVGGIELGEFKSIVFYAM